jgi:prepilin-type processing-associated H-X9-DG protein
MQYRLSTIFLVFFFVAATLALFGTWGICIAPIILLVAFLVYWFEITPSGLFATIFFIGVVVLFLFPVWESPTTSRRAICVDNMKQIGLGLHNYHDVHKKFPSIITCDKSGKPLFSWLVEILPNMEYGTLYDALKKDEPWNSPHNAKLLSKLRISEFVCPSVRQEEKDFSTNYVAIIGPGTIWHSDGPVSINDLPNSLSNLVAAVECVDSGKHWAEPYSLTVEEVLERMKTGKGMRICTMHNSVVNVLFADGGVRPLQADMPISIWRKLLRGEIKNCDELDNWKADANDLAPVNLTVSQPPSPPNKWPFLLSILVWLVSLVLLFYRAWNIRPIAEKPIKIGE